MPFVTPVPWTSFQWGSRGLWYFTDEPGIYMAHIFIPYGIRIVFEATGPGGQQFLHVFNCRAPNANPDYTDVLTAAQTVNAWWGSNYRNMVTNTVVGRRTVATGMDAVPAAQATVYTAITGARGGTIVSSEISCAVQWFTHQSGRRNHGGKRGWPPVTTDVSGDHFTSGYLAAMQGVFQNLLNSMNTAGYPLVIASNADQALHVIAGVDIIDDIVDSQRRRTVNRGR